MAWAVVVCSGVRHGSVGVGGQRRGGKSGVQRDGEDMMSSETPSRASHCERTWLARRGKRVGEMWAGEEVGRLRVPRRVMKLWMWVVHQAGAPTRTPSKEVGECWISRRPWRPPVEQPL